MIVRIESIHPRVFDGFDVNGVQMTVGPVAGFKICAGQGGRLVVVMLV